MRGTLIRILGPLLVTLVVLAAVEGALRLYGFQAPVSGGGDPLLNPLPLFHPKTSADGEAMLERHDAPVSFRAQKPANGFRVFVIGDSNATGFPFGAEYAFPRFLQERLAAAMPGRTVEVVNAALNGIASWHALKVLAEVVQYQPDLVIAYVGHGDWIMPGPEEVNPLARLVSQSRFYQLAVVAARRWQQGPLDAKRIRSQAEPYGRARDRARGNETLTTAERQRIAARYADDLRAIVAGARAVGAEVVFAELVQNLRDFPPGGSRHRPGLSDELRARWHASVEQAETSMQAHDCQAALAALRDAEAVDDRPALLYYLRGRCLEELGDFSAADTDYRKASDLDEVPLGAPSSFNQILQDVARDTGARFVPVWPALTSASPHGLVGDAFFADYVHPTPAGHAAIARALAQALGAPDSDGAAADAGALMAAHPEIQEKIYRARTLLLLMLGWHDRALALLDEGGKQYPALLEFRGQVEALRTTDPSRAWDDPPDARD